MRFKRLIILSIASFAVCSIVNAHEKSCYETAATLSYLPNEICIENATLSNQNSELIVEDSKKSALLVLKLKSFRYSYFESSTLLSQQYGGGCGEESAVVLNVNGNATEHGVQINNLQVSALVTSTPDNCHTAPISQLVIYSLKPR